MLGVVVGATFAFYGLPPILRHYYGETKVAADEFYEGDAKIIRVLRVESARPDLPDGPPDTVPLSYYVTVRLMTAKTWAPTVSDFSLELRGGGDWVAGVGYKGANPDGTIPLKLLEETEVTIRFQRPIEASAVPRYLHLASPRVRFALPK
ncbi:MAG: hypothetical protein ABI782_04655 [Anaerolineaceae bacterium]